MTWQFALTGLLIGSLVGLTGMGGGSLLTPILVIVFGFNPTLAVGTDVLHGAVFKSFGALRHRRLGTVHARLTFWMFLGSGPMSLLGVGLATLLKQRYGGGIESVESYAIGAALILGGFGLVAKTLIKRGLQPSDAPFILTRRDRLIAFLIGAVFGFVVGLTSVGSGTFFGLVMVLAYPLTVRKIVGTDIFHAAALLWVAGVGHLLAGNVDLRVIGWLLLGSIPGVLLTSKLTLRIPEHALRLGLALVLILSGVKLVRVPQANWVLVGGLIASGMALAAWGVLEFQRRRRTVEALATEPPLR
ncbi:MAG TPA: sulfite exporter TauE/SafE family protein [Gaiellaceae bacterium]